MGEFIRTVLDPEIPFLRYALIAGTLASVSFGMIGTYVVARRISYIAGAISHCVLGGIGASLYFRHVIGIEWLHPLHGAVVAALTAAVIIGLVSLRAEQREDTVIGALWATGMAVGLLFIAKTPGYVDPMSYLFGNILMISRTDLWIIAGLDVVVVVLAILFYDRFLAVCFDEEFARLRGIHVEFYFLLLLCLTALTVVLLVTVVGIVMVIALLTLPAAVASHFSRRLWQMMGLSILLCFVFTIGGIGFSYTHDLPSGATIILLSASVYLLTAVGQGLWRRRAQRRMALR